MKHAFLFAAALVLGMGAKADEQLKLNQIQVIGSHNSYHAGLLPGIAKLLSATDPDALAGLDYSHAPLDTQLSRGIRQIELDIYADAKGGNYASPLGPRWVAEAGLPADPPPYQQGVMTAPGFKVLHMQDLDYVSTCQPFRTCLEQVKGWSDSHPGHLPLFVLIETKQSETVGRWEMTRSQKFTRATLDALDASIRSVFSEDRLITPDKVRGRYDTLEAAVLAGNWPTLAEARGKLMFLMDQKNVSALYLAGHSGLRGRILFTNADPGSPDAAFVERNEGSAAEIADLVRRGYLVRTRTDKDTVQARTNDTSRRDEAMASGAQLLSTDYPVGEPSRWTGYQVSFPGDVPARCNPVAKSTACKAEDLAP
jgi:hypothetical protein